MAGASGTLRSNESRRNRFEPSFPLVGGSTTTLPAGIGIGIGIRGFRSSSSSPSPSIGVSGPSSSPSWMTSPNLPESLERFRRPAAAAAAPAPPPRLPSRVGESVGRDFVVEPVDSVRDGTSGRWRSSADRLEDDDDDPRSFQTSIRRVTSGSSSSTVSHPPPFAVSSSCSSVEKGDEWHESRMNGEWMPP